MSRVPMQWLAVACLLLVVADAARSQGDGLPEGAVRQQVEGLCSACHALNRIGRSAGYSQDGWKALIATMLDLSGDPARQEAVTGYLASHFPPNTRHAPTLVPGTARIRFTEWVTPTLGQRARDPIQAADGTLWWAGQWANLIGRIDPATGAMKEYPLPPQSMPHTVTLDRAGNVWFTGNKNATLGKLDPATGAVTTFKMPDPAAKDPHSSIFDEHGVLWFTLQNSNRVGRLDPASGAIELATLPTPGSRPYGIKIDAHGVPWVACNGSNCLIWIDPRTLQLTEVKLPDPASTVRRLAFASDGTLWFVNSSLGRLGRLDPATGEIKEWPSPSGPKSHPYAIAVVDDVVWYNESGMRPDTLVRFDPGAQTFQSWPIPSGSIHAGIVRHMRPTREGNLLIHQSSTNRIILVTLKEAP